MTIYNKRKPFKRHIAKLRNWELFGFIGNGTSARVKVISPTRPNSPPTRRKILADASKLPADASKLPADASKVFRRRDYFILDASASRVGYAADATRNRHNEAA